MMIDFEDKMPAPPMSRGERILLGLLIILTLYGLLGQFLQLMRWIYALFH